MLWGIVYLGGCVVAREESDDPSGVSLGEDKGGRLEKLESSHLREADRKRDNAMIFSLSHPEGKLLFSKRTASGKDITHISMETSPI